MAWEWSHTQEAYATAHENLQAVDLDELQVIYAEWESATLDECGGREHDSDLYFAALERVQRDRLPADVLADAIWERAAEQATCTNGGHEAWMCPHGCGPHLVPFSPVEDEKATEEAR